MDRLVSLAIRGLRVTAGSDAQQIFGPGFQAMAANLGKAIEDGAVEVIQAVFTKS